MAEDKVYVFLVFFLLFFMITTYFTLRIFFILKQCRSRHEELGKKLSKKERGYIYLLENIGSKCDNMPEVCVITREDE